VSMAISLRGAGRKVAFAVLVLVPSVYFVRAAAHPWLADRLGSQVSGDSLRRAAEYEPGNAERYFAYARYLHLVDHNMEAAAWNFRAATEIDPHRGRYWIELADALRALQDTSGEGAALRQAVRHDPTNPDVALRAANAFLLRGEKAEAVREFRVAMDYDPNQAPLIFATLWRNTHDAGMLIRDALPSDPRYHAALLQVFIQHDEARAAAEVWRRWMMISADVPTAAAFPYLDYLCQRREYDAALSAWNDLARRAPEVRSRQTPGNLISNGDFEEPVLNGGFEWRYARTPLASLDLDTTRFHSGNASLRLEFNGETGGDAGIAQFIVLPPNQAFAFHGFIRTEAIYSTHGPRLSITDVASGSAIYNSEESVGTTPWIERKTMIPAASQTRLIAVRVTREPVTHITGRAWIDDLTLTPDGRP
jgi:tetratricopeptide (TPR) repeat protein